MFEWRLLIQERAEEITRSADYRCQANSKIRIYENWLVFCSLSLSLSLSLCVPKSIFSVSLLVSSSMCVSLCRHFLYIPNFLSLHLPVYVSVFFASVCPSFTSVRKIWFSFRLLLPLPVCLSLLCMSICLVFAYFHFIIIIFTGL